MPSNTSPRNKAPFGSIKTNLTDVGTNTGSNEGNRSSSKEKKSRSRSPGIPTSPGFDPRKFEHIARPVYVFGELDPAHISKQKRKLLASSSDPEVVEVEKEVRHGMKNKSPEVK